MLVLLLLCIALGGASFASGWLGVVLPSNADRIRAFNSAGTGLLIGSALAIVIPEGIDLVHAHDTAQVDGDGHRYVGLVCVVGFLLMSVLDTFMDRLQHSHTPKSQYVSIEALHEMGIQQRNGTRNEPHGTVRTEEHANALSTTIGLVVHSLADGVALGAAYNASSRVSAVVFLAMLVHKFPAAFGLASVLMRCQLSRRDIRLHLVAFAAAAPLGALLTYLAINSFLGATAATTLELATGLLVVFSGGTFLYVAVSHLDLRTLGSTDLLCYVGGLLLPVVLQLLTHHEH